MIGSKGNDLLKGSKGDDYLDGSKGVDTLVGGKGKDVFQISKGIDIILDFEIKEGDSIGLDKNGKFTIVDDDQGVLIIASANKQIFLEDVNYDDIMDLGNELFVQSK